MAIVLLDSFSEANADGWVGLPGDTQRIAQSFRPSQNATLDNVRFYVTRANNVTGNAVARIYALTGTPGTNAIPTGSALASSNNLDVTTVANGGFNIANFALHTLTFSGANRISLSSSTDYFVSIEYTTADYLLVGQDNSSPADGGNTAFWNGSAWQAYLLADTCFYVYGDDGVVAGLPSKRLLMGVGK